MNKEILMVAILVISVFLLASSVYVYINDKYTNELPDEEYHFIIGTISNKYTITNNTTIEFVGGDNITFSGKDIKDAVTELNDTANYTFYWRWSDFENSGYIGKKCCQINSEKNIIWQGKNPITVELIAGFVILWVVVGTVLFVGMLYNRRIDERKK